MLIKWKRHPAQNDCIIGWAEELPDNMCQFAIIRLSHNKFWVMLPAMGTTNFNKRLVLRDADVARQFCQDYLDHNLKEIISNQISEMNRRSLKGFKPPIYYENLLRRMEHHIEQHKILPKAI